MKVLQINLHRSLGASFNLVLHLNQDGADIVLIQEPRTVENRVCGIRTDGYNLLYHVSLGRPRS